MDTDAAGAQRVADALPTEAIAVCADVSDEDQVDAYIAAGVGAFGRIDLHHLNAGIFGSIDANAGDDRLGWDVDRFPVSVEQMTLGMLEILRGGGFTTGGLNFDSKLRRQSSDRTDLFYAHIGGMDAFARGLKIAAAMRADGKLEEMLRDRYASWDTGLGAEIEGGKHDLASLEKIMLTKGEAAPNRSGRQELLENLINTYL